MMLDKNKKMMMIGLFLSKFDKKGLEALGFSRFWEAYNAFAFALDGLPKTINNYRDEFDPYFPNPRKGWKSRSLRPSRKSMMEKYANLSLEEFAAMIREIVSPLGDADSVIEATENDLENASFAKRIITGLSAEKHFTAHYQEIPCFSTASLVRTTHFGCGFDFKLEVGGKPFLAVEVKGLGAGAGQFQMTSKEYRVAEYLKERYFLYILRGFETPKPFFTLIQNPLASDIEFSNHEIVMHQTYWTGEVKKSLASNCMDVCA
ncbi:MAG: DUF3883 domain-containing protein [Kiritimatiellae bacterium]|nr:DUF3883 domain-containing protein [Kiritimatiellia bacterium]